MSTLLDKAWDAGGKAFGTVFGSGPSKKSGQINYVGTNIELPVVYGDDIVGAQWAGFRKLSERRFGALALFCYAPIEGFDYIEINGYKHYPTPEYGNQDNYQWPQSSGDHGIKYRPVFDGKGIKDEKEYFLDDTNYPVLEWPGQTQAKFFKGVVGVFFEFDVKKGFVTSIPNVTMKVRGRNHLFDPRIDAAPGEFFKEYPTYAWQEGQTATACTNNALIHADMLTNKWYGKGLSWDKINLDQLSAAANLCDHQVLDGDGEIIKLMEFNGRLDTAQKIDKNLELIDKSMRAHAPYHNGQFGLVIRDDYPTPDEIPKKWIEKHYEISHGEKSGRFNSCLVTYKEPLWDLEENQVIYPPFGSAEETQYLSEDGGEVLQEEITLTGCRNRYQAIDFAESIVKESRLQLETKLDLLAPAIKYQAGDVVDVPLKGVGLTRMRIQIVTYHDDLRVTWTLKEHSNDAYPWTTKTSIPVPAKDEANPLIISAPANVALTPDTYNEFSSGVLSWDAIDHLYVKDYAVAVTNTDTGQLVASFKVEGTTTKLQNLPAANYSISVRALLRLANGPETLIAVVIDNPLIDTITNLQLEEGGTEFTGFDCAFNWDEPTNSELVVHDYVVGILNPANDAVYFTATTTNTNYTFTYAQNVLVGLYRNFKIKVYARGKYGQDNYSTGAATLTVNNPLPMLPNGVTTSATQDSIKLEFSPINEVDFKQVKVWLSDSSGFSATDGQQKVTTKNNQIELSGLEGNTPYYVRFSVLDVFHTDSDIGVLSSEYKIYTAADALKSATTAINRGNAYSNLQSAQLLLASAEGIQSKKEIIKGNSKVEKLELIKDEQIIVIDALTVETESQKNSILTLQQVDTSQATLISQVQSTASSDKSELQGNLDAVEGDLQGDIATVQSEANSALVAATGYCSLSDYTTQGTCEASGGTWINEPFSQALMNATIDFNGSEITAGTFFDTLATNGALNATAGLYTDNNGVITGIFHGTNETTSSMVFKADKFSFLTGDGNKNPFSISGNDVVIENAIFKGDISIAGGAIEAASAGAIQDGSEYSLLKINVGGNEDFVRGISIAVSDPDHTGLTLYAGDGKGMYIRADNDFAAEFFSLSHVALSVATFSTDEPSAVFASLSGPQIRLSPTVSSSFPALLEGAFFAHSAGLYFGLASGWGRVSFSTSHAAGTTIPTS